MSKIEPLVPLLDALRDLVTWLKANRTQGLIMGGVTASILGRPRVTRDIGALILLDEKNGKISLQREGDLVLFPD